MWRSIQLGNSPWQRPVLCRSTQLDNAQRQPDTLFTIVKYELLVLVAVVTIPQVNSLPIASSAVIDTTSMYRFELTAIVEIKLLVSVVFVAIPQMTFTTIAILKTI